MSFSKIPPAEHHPSSQIVSNSPGTSAIRKYLPVFALLIVVGLSAARDAEVVFQHPQAVGVNGYYYVLQVDHIRAHGRDYFSKVTPGVLYLLAGISYLTGDTVVAIKLGAIVLHAALCVGIFLLVSGCLRSGWYGVAGAFLLAISGLHFHFLTEFVSNLGGWSLLVLSAWCALKFADRKKPRWVVASLFLLVLAVFSHRSILPVAGLLLICGALENCLLARERIKAKRIFAILTIAVVWAAPALLAAQQIFPLPESWLRELSIRPRVPLDRYGFPESTLLIVVSISVLAVFLWQRWHHSGNLAETTLATAALFSLVVTLNPFFNPELGSAGVGQRLRFASYIQVAILVPGLIWLLRRVNRKGLIPYAIALVASIMIASVTLPWPTGLRSDYLARRETLIRSLKRVAPELGPSTMVVAPHGDQFVVTAATGLPSQQRPPSQSQFQTVYWLLNDVTDPAFTTRSRLLFKTQSGATMLADDVIVREWWKVMSQTKRRKLLEKNPTLKSIQSLDPAT